MKSYKIFSASLALLLGWSGAVFAQNEADALRYTRLGIHGSARIQGIGGAQSALGADISTMAVNPAGLGMFRRSEVSVTPGISAFNSSTSIVNSKHYSGQTTTDSQTGVNLPQAGFVLSNRKDDSEGGDWRGTTIGLSVTRLNNFNTRTNYRGTTSGNPDDWTMTDYFAELANNSRRTKASLDAEFGDFMSLEGLAYGTYLIDIFEDEIGEYAAPVSRSGKISFNEEIIRRGSQNQIDFGLGTSYKDKLYLGASVGIISSNFSQERQYRESEASASTPFTGLFLRDEFTSSGAGINLKAGAIFRPLDAFRVGVSVQTPTAYTFDEIYNRSLTSSFSDTGDETATELPGEFSYKLMTPLRATGGVAVFLNKYGFLTADVEYVNYAGMRFSENDEYGSTGDYFSGVNSRIEDTYKSAVNVKVGAEGRYEIFRFRAGYAVSGDPYKNADIDGKINTFTLGAGIRLQNFYVDAAYTNSSNIRSRYSPYTFNEGESPTVDINEKLTNVLFTVGYNF